MLHGSGIWRIYEQVYSDEALRNLWRKTEGQMGLHTSEKMGQKSYMQVYTPEKGIDPSVRTLSPHLEDL